MGITIKIYDDVRTSARLLEFKLSISRFNAEERPVYTNKMYVNDRVVFQAMVCDMKSDSIKYFVKFTKTNKNDKLDYIISTSHTLLNVGNYVIYKDFTTADDSWHSVADEVKLDYYSDSYVVKLEIKNAPLNMSFVSIHEDADLTDFELRGVDGSVRMHKAVAASCSPFFKTLFMGSWRETAGGLVEVPDISVTTLNYLKDFMYLGKVPACESDDLRQLLLLSSCYMMSDLGLRCVYELSRHATTENAFDFIDFAVKHKQYHLLFALLQMVKSDNLSLDEMEKFYT